MSVEGERPLRVMHVIANLGSGGVQHLLARSLPVFDRAVAHHRVACVTAGGVYEASLVRAGVPYWIMQRRTRFDPTVIWQLARLLRRERIDVVHTLNFTANAWGRLAAFLAGVPRIIAHERGTGWTENGVMRLVDRLLYTITEVLLANSEAARIILTRHIGVPPERIRVVYNGLPAPAAMAKPRLRPELQLGPNTPLIGAVGRLDTPKGLPFMLRAIPLVWQTHPDAHFVIVGDGPLKLSLEAMAQSLGLLQSGRVHFLGFMSDAAGIMPELDLLLHTAVRESLGNVLIEAGFCGLPVVASNVDGCAEVVVDGETGLLVDCTEPVTMPSVAGATPLPAVVVDGRSRQLRAPLGPDPARLAQAVNMLLAAPDLRREIGVAARRRMEKTFTLDRYVAQLEAVYQGR